MMRFLTLASALWLVLLAEPPTTAAAEPESAAAAEPGTQLTVSGPPGAFLRVDDKPIGRLPLETTLFVAAGPHRFQLELQGQSYVSDILAIPQGRAAELSLSLGSQGTAMAVLSLKPIVLVAPSRGDGDPATVGAEQAVSVQPTLTPRPSEPASASLLPPPPLPVPAERLRRPRWRLITGGIALGVGVVIAGLGFAGVAQPAACVNPSPTAGGSCSGVPLTASLGAAGVAVGLAVAGVGGALIAAPARAQKN